MPTEKVVVLVALQLAEVVVIGVELLVFVVVVAQLVGVALVVAGVVVGRPVVGLMLLLLPVVAAVVPSAASAAFVLVGIVSFTESTIPCSGWTSCRGAATAAPVLSRYST